MWYKEKGMAFRSEGFVTEFLATKLMCLCNLEKVIIHILQTWNLSPPRLLGSIKEKKI